MAWKEIEFLDTTTRKGMFTEINRLVQKKKKTKKGNFKIILQPLLV